MTRREQIIDCLQNELVRQFEHPRGTIRRLRVHIITPAIEVEGIIDLEALADAILDRQKP